LGIQPGTRKKLDVVVEMAKKLNELDTEAVDNFIEETRKVVEARIALGKRKATMGDEAKANAKKSSK
jgi:hypothetical protein